MKTLKLLSVIALGFAMLLSEVSFAHGRVDRRQHMQRARIHEGVESGELTKKEAAGLRSQQRHIRRAERRAEADGVVTPEEKAKLERKQDRASRQIYKQKHDGQERDNNTAPTESVPTEAAPAN